MRVLVADDDASTRLLIRRVLEMDGFEVLTARDGLEALAMLDAAEPDILVTDYLMPGLNGLELCRAVASRGPVSFLPIIMLTAGDDRELLLRSLEAGALEFLRKPIHAEELRSRLRAIAILATTHQALARAQVAMDEELGIVKILLDRVTRPGLATLPPRFTMETLQTKRVNGDACAYLQSVAGVHFGLICDATGHGLAAGVSTLPVIEAFNAMASRDTPLDSIYLEVNRKLLRMMPTGHFACMLLLRLDTQEGHLQVLNAGMPDLLHIEALGGTLHRHRSENLPAGILANPRQVRIGEARVRAGDRLFACSDGLLELFTEEQMAASFLRRGLNHPVAEDHALLRKAITNTLQNAEQQDDMTWALWEVPPPTEVPESTGTGAQSNGEGRIALGLRLAVDPRLAHLKELVPNTLGLLSYQGVPQATLQILGLLLTETLTNGIDHGLLRVESSLKDQGFEAYEARKRQSLDAFEQGEVVCLVELQFRADQPTVLEKIHVQVSDTGPGFDWRAVLQKEPGDLIYAHGRGLQLIRSLTSGLTFNEAGNSLSFTLSC
jgi:CheY-like chemotaxis protein